MLIDADTILTAIITEKPESTISIALSGSRLAGESILLSPAVPQNNDPHIEPHECSPQNIPQWLSPTHYGTLCIVVFWLTSC